MANGKVKLDSIAGNTKTAGQFDTGAVAPSSVTDRLNLDAEFYASRVYNPQYMDYAEYFKKGEETEPGDVIVLRNGLYVKSDCRADKMVRGVHSDTWGHIVGGDLEENQEERFIPVGLSGRIRVKVKGLCRPGEWLITDMYENGVAVSTPDIIPGAVFAQVEEEKNTLGIDRIWAFIRFA